MINWLSMKPVRREKKFRKKTSEVASLTGGLKVETGNSILDSLFNDELVKPETYDQNIVSIVRNHLARTDLNAKAGAKLAEDLIAFAKASLTEPHK